NGGRGHPIATSLRTEPLPASATSALPAQSTAKQIGRMTWPGPSPLTPHSPRYSSGGGGGLGGACGLLREQAATTSASRITRQNEDREARRKCILTGCTLALKS